MAETTLEDWEAAELHDAILTQKRRAYAMASALHNAHIWALKKSEEDLARITETVRQATIAVEVTGELLLQATRELKGDG